MSVTPAASGIDPRVGRSVPVVGAWHPDVYVRLATSVTARPHIGAAMDMPSGAIVGVRVGIASVHDDIHLLMRQLDQQWRCGKLCLPIVDVVDDISTRTGVHQCLIGGLRRFFLFLGLLLPHVPGGTRRGRRSGAGMGRLLTLGDLSELVQEMAWIYDRALAEVLLETMPVGGPGKEEKPAGGSRC